ncbi:hypothetical protein G3N95_01755 [Paraburkholderia sp. Tr-20389]|nr:hypothetical protein [Paraburkholderia sp. Tr-20389]MBN3751646.1 hypothetical protein [Paraburkholderia sp. Tr-20389]
MFSTKLDKGKPYAIAIQAQPVVPPQTCNANANYSGIANSNIQNIVVTCS